MTRHVPTKVRELAMELLATQDVEACLAHVRNKYDKMTTRKDVLAHIKAVVVECDTRHPDYAEAMTTYETRLREVAALPDERPSALERLRTFYEFRGCPLKRQMQIQAKITKGLDEDKTPLCDPRDRPFYTALPLVPPWFHELRLNKDEVRHLMERQRQTLQELSSSVVTIDNGGDVVRRARKSLRADRVDPLDLAIALAVTTGRRMVEIFLTGFFAEDPQDRYSVLFHGQAKCGLRELQGMAVDVGREYSIPVLATGSSIARGISRLRGISRSGEMTPKDVNRLWCKKLNQRVRQNLHPDMTFHDLRTFYALVSFEAFKPHTYGINGWVSKSLGHCSVAMSVHYTRMQIHRVGRLIPPLRTEPDEPA